MAKIRILPDYLSNQIAAGEVIERPASIIKELVENSLDAGASSIEISINNGGKSFISVRDDGIGMALEDLELCLYHHSTSKLQNDDIENINTLGFRGEALSSISAVSKISIASKTKEQQHGYIILGSNSKIKEPQANPIKYGTLITVKDLFFSVPARLKFLKSDQAESIQCYKIFKRLATSNPHVNFKFINNGKVVFNYNNLSINQELSSENEFQNLLTKRATEVIGKELKNNSFYINKENENMSLCGLFSIPTFNKNHQDDQYIIVNGRSLKDKSLTSIIRVAYSEVIPYGKHPSYVVFININPNDIDVNVNPTKSEVRFKDSSFVRHLILSSIRESIKGLSQTSSNISEQLIKQSINQPELKSYSNHQINDNYHNVYSNFKTTISTLNESKTPNYNDANIEYALHANSLYAENDKVQNTSTLYTLETNNDTNEIQSYPLGFAKAQIQKNWIIAENEHGIILVDQHAAHERVTHEHILEQYNQTSIVSQQLLVPSVIFLDAEEMLIATNNKAQIQTLGIEFDIFGENTISVYSFPAILKNPNIEEMIKDLLKDLQNIDTAEQFKKQIHKIISSLACHGSVRAGQTLSIDQMNHLLRNMEKTTNFTQCSHGRPTFIQLDIKNIEKLFGR